MNWIYVCLTSLYDYYNQNTPDAYTDRQLQQTNTDRDYGLYGPLSRKTLQLERGVFTILMNGAVIASGVVFLIAVAALALATFGNNQKLAEEKKWIVRVVIISILIFSVTLAISLIQRMGLG